MVRDPVCGVEMDRESAPASSEHEGTIYYFCSEACKEEFDADPNAFIEIA
ncbi:MAG TPA: YHS domain-containing protein [Dehalococcoidia bacterium]|nr:YHS domain-containing protein [Dehalococcoidia bacterium]